MSSEAMQASSAPRGERAALALEREQLPLLGLGALMLLAPAALIYLSFNAGGYFPSAPGFVAIVFAQALILRSTLAGRPFEGFSRTLAIPLLALVLYAAWQLASTLWSHATSASLDSYDRTLLYVLAFALFGSLRYTPERMRWLLRALVAGMAAVCLIGLISRVLPHAWPTASSFFNDRLNYPLTYWNAEGMLATTALILGFHLSADRDEHWSVRVLAAALLPAIAATLLLTFSRGAMGVAIVGLLAYCVLTRLHTLPATLLATVPSTAIALRSAWDATLLASSKPTSAAAVAQGRHVAAVVGACMLGAGLLRGALLIIDRRLGDLPLVRTPPRLAVRAGIGVAATVIVLAVVLALGAAGFAQREYDKFVNEKSGPHTAQTRERLSDPANNGRLSLWKAAVRIYDTQELRGTGAGTYQLYYPRYRTERLYVVDTHSLYLQSLAELGVVGFVLILLVVLGILGGLAARIRGPDRALYAALLAATLAWAIHQAFDWDWQMPAVTLGVFMLAGLALARPADGGPGRFGLPAGRTLVGLGWLVLAVAPLLVSISYARLQQSGAELKSGNCTSAKREALSSLSLSAKRPQAYVIIGVCDLQQGFAQAAVPAMAEAATLTPQSWENAYWLAVARAAAGLDPHAAIRRAIALDPLEHGLRNAEEQLSPADRRTWELAAPRLRREALTSGKFAITNL
ncbi:MAG TPA: O-antigen ligase family protein [Solirubrobacteraceae bacterium]|nr:O-antigen ligase family protein [Solirubrobacteraceae bacterium]